MTIATTGVLPRVALATPRPRAGPAFSRLGAWLLAVLARLQVHAGMRRMLRGADPRMIADLGISPAQAAFEASRFPREKN